MVFTWALSLHFTAYDAYRGDCGGSGITVGPNSVVDLDYSLSSTMVETGLELGLGSSISGQQHPDWFQFGLWHQFRRICRCGLQCIPRQRQSKAINRAIFYSRQFHSCGSTMVYPRCLTDNVYAVPYSNVQGINALLTSSSFAWGDGCIGTDPVFADSLSSLGSILSLCRWRKALGTRRSHSIRTG